MTKPEEDALRFKLAMLREQVDQNPHNLASIALDYAISQIDINSPNDIEFIYNEIDKKLTQLSKNVAKKQQSIN